MLTDYHNEAYTFSMWLREGDRLRCDEHNTVFAAGRPCPSCTPADQDPPETLNAPLVGGDSSHWLRGPDVVLDLVAEGIEICRQSGASGSDVKRADGLFKAARIVREVRTEERVHHTIAELRRELNELRALTEQAGAGRFSQTTTLPTDAGEAAH